MSSSTSTRIAMLSIVLAVAIPLGGCGLRAARQAVSLTHSSVPSSSAMASATVPAAASSAAAPATEHAAGAASAATAHGAKTAGKAHASVSMTPAEAGAIDAELSAIQLELGRLKAPDESDFDSVGSGLK